MNQKAPMSGGRILLILGRLVLAGVFLFAAYAKLKPQGPMPWSPASVRTSLAMFAMQVDSYQLLPESAVNFVAHLLPPFELLLGLWLLTGIALRFSSLITVLLLGGFFTVMVHSYMAGLEINCGCFGPGEKLGPWTLFRDGSLLAVAIAVTVGSFQIRRNQVPQQIAASPAAPIPEGTR
jgi:uncharacterized membrane protein YphA (DoxX/SURF4 family)